MQYVLLIYGNETDYAKMTLEEQQTDFQEYMQFTADIRGSGAHKYGEPLQSVTTATTVRVQNGKRVITDGPFAETKEQLAGFYMIECKDLEEALDIAAKCPGAKHGSIEVRPVMEIPD